MTDKKSTEPLAELRREQFEKWAAQKGLDLCPCDNASCGSWKHYQFDATVWAWEAWQAASEIREEALERAARKIAEAEIASSAGFLRASEVLEILRDEIGGK